MFNNISHKLIIKSSIPLKTSPYNIIILFLAHKGISQSEFWNDWYNMCHYKKNLHLRVHAPDNSTFIKYKIFKLLPNYNKNTDWCRENIVYVYLQCLKMILDEFGKNTNGIIYLVSGADIPITPANYLFESSDKNNLYKEIINPFKSQLCDIEFKLNSNRIGVIQWMALTFIDANALYILMIKRGIFHQLTKSFLTDLLNNKYIDCPDNYFITTAIWFNKDIWIRELGGSQDILDMIKSNKKMKQFSICPTADWRNKTSGCPSPIEWYSNKTKHYLDNFTGPNLENSCILFTLKQLIIITRLYRAKSSPHLFFRKVMKETNLKEMNIKFLINPKIKPKDIYIKFLKESNIPPGNFYNNFYKKNLWNERIKHIKKIFQKNIDSKSIDIFIRNFYKTPVLPDSKPLMRKQPDFNPDSKPLMRKQPDFN